MAFSQFAPGFLVDMVRAYRDVRYRSRPPFSGLYESFGDVGSPEATFNTKMWAQGVRAAADAALAANDSGSIPVATKGDAALLPFLCSLVAQPDTVLRILDFGGGAGVSYAAVRGGAVGAPRVSYVVVEIPDVARAGADLFQRDPAIQFVSDISLVSGPFDIVFVSTALQYIDDWGALLSRFAALKPRYILFSRLSVGDVPTFVTAQINVPGHRLPYRFINYDEFLRVLERLNYTLLFKGASLDSFAQHNHPQAYRLAFNCNLLFRAV